jgi:branched-chain amino acid transport system substrate-binding protein
MIARVLKRCLLVTIAALLVVPAGAAVAQDKGPIKIGVVISYSGGDNVILGKMIDAGFATYMKQHGDTIAGRKVVLIKRDDTGIAPETAGRLAQELVVQEHVDLLIGATYTPNAIAMAAISTRAKVPYFIVNAATSGIMAKNPYTARFAFTTAQLTQPFAAWAYKGGAKTAYAVFQDYGPGIDAGNMFEKTFTGAGGKVLGESRIPVGAKDFTAYIQKVKDAKPDVMFLFLNASGGGVDFIKALNSAGFEKTGIKFLATGDLVDEAILPTEGETALGIVTTFDYSAMHDSKMNRDFVKAFETAYGSSQPPSFMAVQAYDAIAAAYNVLEAQKGVLDPDKTMALLRGMKFESPRGPVEIDANTRDMIETVYFRKVERRGGMLGNYEFDKTPAVKDPNEQ